MATRKLLIVEDDPKSLYALRSVLQDNGFQVVACVSAEAAEALNEDHFTAAILDIRLPGASGMEVAARLLRNNSKVLIIFVTAFEVLKEMNTTFPGCIVMVKPIDMALLLRLLPPSEETGRSGKA